MTHREDFIARKMRTCIHFNGIQSESCKAGVKYEEKFSDGKGHLGPIPCCGDDNPQPCELLVLPSREQAERLADKHEVSMQKLTKCVNATHEHAKARGLGKGHGGTGDLPCPTGCGGILHYSVAAYNGHIWANCSTPNCVRWME